MTSQLLKGPSQAPLGLHPRRLVATPWPRPAPPLVPVPLVSGANCIRRPRTAGIHFRFLEPGSGGGEKKLCRRSALRQCCQHAARLSQCRSGGRRGGGAMAVQSSGRPVFHALRAYAFVSWTRADAAFLQFMPSRQRDTPRQGDALQLGPAAAIRLACLVGEGLETTRALLHTDRQPSPLDVALVPGHPPPCAARPRVSRPGRPGARRVIN